MYQIYPVQITVRLLPPAWALAGTPTGSSMDTYTSCACDEVLCPQRCPQTGDRYANAADSDTNGREGQSLAPSFGEAGAFLGSAQATASSHNGRCLRVEPFPNGTWVLKEAVHFHRRPVFSGVSAIPTLSEQMSVHVYVLHPASHSVTALQCHQLCLSPSPALNTPCRSPLLPHPHLGST